MEEAAETCLGIAGWQVIVVCGNNTRLRKRLTGLARNHPERLRVLGYRRDIPDLMAASDLLVTKGGGLSLTEALYVGVRTVVVPGLPGQEHANIEFLERLGWIQVCQRLKDLSTFLPSLLDSEASRPHLPPRSSREAAAALDGLARAGGGA